MTQQNIFPPPKTHKAQFISKILSNKKAINYIAFHLQDSFFMLYILLADYLTLKVNLYFRY